MGGNNLHFWCKNSIKTYRKKVRDLLEFEQLQDNIISLRSTVELSVFVYISRDTKLFKLQTKYGLLILSTNRIEQKRIHHRNNFIRTLVLFSMLLIGRNQKT